MFVSRQKLGGPPRVYRPLVLIQYIHSYPPYLEAIPLSVTWRRAMSSWQGTFYDGSYWWLMCFMTDLIGDLCVYDGSYRWLMFYDSFYRWLMCLWRLLSVTGVFMTALIGDWCVYDGSYRWLMCLWWLFSVTDVFMTALICDWCVCDGSYRWPMC